MTSTERVEAIKAIIEFMKAFPGMPESSIKECEAKIMELIRML